MAVEAFAFIYQLELVIYSDSGVSDGVPGSFLTVVLVRSRGHEALDILVQAVADCGYSDRVQFAIDPASSEFFRDGNYNLGFKGSTPDNRTPTQLRELYHSLLEKYPVTLIEDPFAENDWDSWTEFNKECEVELVGDDLLVTNTKYVQQANDKKACDSMLLKINQIGTITEAIAA